MDSGEADLFLKVAPPSRLACVLTESLFELEPPMKSHTCYLVCTEQRPAVLQEFSVNLQSLFCFRGGGSAVDLMPSVKLLQIYAPRCNTLRAQYRITRALSMEHNGKVSILPILNFSFTCPVGLEGCSERA